MPSPSTASQSRINAERLAHLLPKGNPPDSIRPEHALRGAQAAVDKRLIAVCDALTPDLLGGIVRVNRNTWVQIERRDRILMHLFQHQIHHRGQAHAMLSGTSVAPPQLDEFFAEGEAPLRAEEFRELRWTEAMIWTDFRTR